MTDDEVVDLLTLAASFDRRKVGDADADAWFMAVGDLPFEDAQVAVVKHYRDSGDWLMPVHVRRLVKQIREERINATPLPAPDHEVADKPALYQAAMQDILRHTGNGRMPFKSIAGGKHRGDEPSEEFKTARSQEDRDRVLAQTVPCPVEWCPALPGEPCRPGGGGEPLAKWHPTRIEAALLDAGEEAS